MNLRKLVVLLLAVFVVFYVLSFPEEAANIVETTVTALGDAAASFATFVRGIFS